MSRRVGWVVCLAVGVVAAAGCSDQDRTVPPTTTRVEAGSARSFPPTETVPGSPMSIPGDRHSPPEVATAQRAALAADVEGRTFSSAALRIDGATPAFEQNPGLAGVSVSFSDGAISGYNGGCQTLSGTYLPGTGPLSLSDVRQSSAAVGCDTAPLGDLVTKIIASAELTWDGSTLSLTSPSGTLTLHNQSFRTASNLMCVPGVDTLHQGQITGTQVGNPSDDPVQATRQQLAANSETSGLYLDADLNAVMVNPDQALISGTKAGRPVLSVVLGPDLGHTGWVISNFAGCMADNTAATGTLIDGAAATTTP